MTALRHLAHLLRGRWFRRLFAVRVASQLTDGVFQVALASYVVFSPERAPGPGAIAGALAVVLLPFSVLGPFVGVFLDRWSRRQVLAWANFARVGIVALLAVAVLADLRGAGLFALVLACLSVNRFLLAGLSAALPHVVRDDELITANALTPTAGTLAFLVGLALGAAARAGWERAGVDSDAGVLLTAAVLYGLSGLLALRIPRALLGPDLGHPPPALRDAVGSVARGLVAGLRHLGRRRPAAYGLAAIGAHRFLYGISFVSLVLLYRNYFHGPGEVDAAFTELSVAVLVSGAGFVAAAVLTPVVTERVAPRTWVLGLLSGAAVTQVLPGGLYTRPALLVAAFFLGLASQGIKIVVDTLVQTHIDDEFRGRVFSLYDVIFNVAFVAAAAVAAVVLPVTGKSYGVLVAISLGYAATALWYARVTRAARPYHGRVVDYERVEVRSAAELHEWLAEEHATSPGAWLVTWKKGRGPYLPYVEIVRELLCYGWIDSKGNRVDDDRTSLLICPRRPGGGWSRVNKEHIEVLLAEGRMQPAGQAAIDRAVADGSWTRLDAVETLAEPDDLKHALDAVPAAREQWDAFPRSARRAILEWISSAKREPTRAKRVAETVGEAAAGRRANEWRPGRR